MKILLTGITGFIGSHLAERLVAEDNEVHAIIRPTSKIEELSDKLQQKISFHIHDENNSIKQIINNINIKNIEGGGA